MIIYEADKKRFVEHVFDADIQDVVEESFRKRTGRRASPSEINAWASSLVYMGKVLRDDAIPDDCGVAIEYGIPQSPKRVDFILTGKSEAGRSCAVIIELKQWQAAKKTNKDAVVLTRFLHGEKETPHPSYQAWSYAAILEGFNEAVYGGGIELKPCAYLHNYAPPADPIKDSFYSAHIERAPVFLKGERDKLRDFILLHVRKGDRGSVLYEMENGRIRPSKSLADALVGLLKRQPEFVLIDDQKLVHEEVLQQVRRAQNGARHVVIVDGGPGTGKSVVAINLLVSIIDSGFTARYVTKNAAPRAVYESRLTGTFKKTEISNLFTGSGSFTESAENDWDAIVVDEAHRLNEKSGLYANLGENQILELMRAARCTVFFIDESQKVTIRDIGTKRVIKEWAEKLGARTTVLELASQFRCNGSDNYLDWLDQALQVRTTPAEFLDPVEFDFRVVDSPTQLRELIVQKNRERNRARMVAGYCWDWPSKKNPAAFDIDIPQHGFKARWNLTQDGGLWMVSPESVNEVGCIHTCQGLEVDYIGVIVGRDLIVRNGRVLTRPEMRARSDNSVKGLKKMLTSDPEAARKLADEIIKNTYRTLMTRGMKGCYVYFEDAEAAEFFRGRIKSSIVEQEQVEPEVRPFQVIPASDAIPYENALPVIPLKLAAGAFSGTQALDVGSVEWGVPSGVRISPDMFIAQVVGESMNRRIPSGSWCVFRANPAGTRQNKVVLAQHRTISDPETGGSYTVKVYTSEKAADIDEGWKHVRIKLSPSSTDATFAPIELAPDSDDPVRVIAELVAVLV